MLAGLILCELEFRTHLLFLEYSWNFGFLPQKFIITGKNQNTRYTNLNLNPQWKVNYFLQISTDAFLTYMRAFSHCLCAGPGTGGSQSCWGHMDRDLWGLAERGWDCVVWPWARLGCAHSRVAGTQVCECGDTCLLVAQLMCSQGAWWIKVPSAHGWHVGAISHMCAGAC